MKKIALTRQQKTLTKRPTQSKSKGLSGFKIKATKTKARSF